MRVLLVQPAPPDSSWGDALPIGLASIASFLRSEHIDVRMVDLGKGPLPTDFAPDIVGIGASTPYAHNAISCSREIRRLFPNARIIFGGHHFSALPEEAFPHADAVVRGEGELAMLDICSDGISDSIVQGTPVADLEDIPYPDEDLLDCIYQGRPERLHIVGSRGCPFTCVFCAEHAETVRYQTVDTFVFNLQRLARRYHNDILVSDDVFTINKTRTAAICERICELDLNLRLNIFGHIRCFDRDLLRLMKRAGVHTVSYGIESGNNAVLKGINKRFTVDQAREVIRRTEEEGVTANCLYMVGNIHETEQTIADTVRFAAEVGSQRWCSFAIPFPGTTFYEVAEEYGSILTRDWSKYRNRNIVYLPHGVTEDYMRRARDAIVGRDEGEADRQAPRAVFRRELVHKR